MIGHFYEASNQYVLKKLIKYVKSKGIMYSLYGFYVATPIQMNFEDFKFKTNTYYLKYVGKDNVSKWLCNDYKPEIQVKKEIFKYCFRIKKHSQGYRLYIKNKKYDLFNSIHLIPYFYHKIEKDDFEKDYNLMCYNDNINVGGDFSKPETLITLDTKFDKHGEEEFISSYEIKEVNNILKVFDNKNYGKLNFQSFFDNYFSDLTENQQKIIALLLIGIRITDIARLLETSQVYITLELGRVGDKINKLYNKKRIDIYEVKDGY